MIGYGVFTDEGMHIGKLGDILWLPANDAYVINDGNREFLIPIIPEIVKSIDYSQRAVLITPTPEAVLPKFDMGPNIPGHS